MLDVQFIGSSHLYALQGSHEAAGLGGRADFKHLQVFAHQHRVAERTPTGVRLFDDVAEWLQSRPPAKNIVVSISGSDWLRLCLTQRSTPFDFVMPEDPQLPLQAHSHVVPVAEVRAELRKQISHVLDGIAALGAHDWNGAALWYLEAPHPVRDSAKIREYLGASTVPWLQAQAELPPTSEWLRLKMSRTHHGIVRRAAEAAGFTYVPAPAEAADADGFLQDSFYGDFMHGNFPYGRTVLDMLQRTLKI